MLLEQDNSWRKYFSEVQPSEDVIYKGFHVLIIGQSKSGKSSLLNFLNYESSGQNQAGFLEFLALKSDSEDAEINIWCMDSILQLESLVEVMLPYDVILSNRFLIIFLIDLSKPLTVFTFLDDWFDLLKNRIEYILTQCTIFLLLAPLPKVSTSTNSTLFPLLVLGNQSDNLEAVFQPCLRPLSTCLAFQNQLRKWAYTHDAAIIFISLKTSENLERFRSYLLHIANNSAYNLSIIENPLKSLFIPFKCDSSDRIEEQAAKIHDVDPNVRIDTHFLSETSSSAKIDQSVQIQLVLSPKFMPTPDNRLKSLIRDGIDMIENNTIENSDNLNNPNAVVTQIINNILSEINNEHDSPFDQLLSCMDDRINSL